MRKVFICILTAVLLVFAAGGMTGCSGDGSESGQSGNGNAQNGQNGNNTNANGNSDASGNGSGGNGGTNGNNDASGCTITTFAIGKGDAILISLGSVNILVDTGEEDDGEYICSRLKEKGVSKLDLLLITHFDKDHVGGAPQILQEISVDKVYYPDYANTKDVFLNFKRAISDRGNEGKITAITEFTAGDLRLRIYPEEKPDTLRAKSDDFDNDMSLVSMLYYKDYKFLFCGDIEKDRTEEILSAQDETGESGIALKCDWIKMPHHGRYNKKIKTLLDACAPSYAVITDSEDAVADTDTQVELIKRKITSFSTRNGEIVTTADSDGLKVEYAE